MRKKIMVVMSILLAVGSISPTLGFASEVESTNEALAKNNVSLDSFIYQIDSLEIESNISLTQDELRKIYSYANINNKISTQSEIIGGSGELFAGPVYKTFSNTTEQEIATVAVSYAMTKIKALKILSQNQQFFVNYFGNKITGWVKNLFAPTYVGYWTTREQRNGVWHYYLTVVNYSDSSFKTPVKVQYGEIY